MPVLSFSFTQKLINPSLYLPGFAAIVKMPASTLTTVVSRKPVIMLFAGNHNGNSPRSVAHLAAHWRTLLVGSLRFYWCPCKGIQRITGSVKHTCTQRLDTHFTISYLRTYSRERISAWLG